jgi:hypothetical protein
MAVKTQYFKCTIFSHLAEFFPKMYVLDPSNSALPGLPGGRRHGPFAQK